MKRSAVAAGLSVLSLSFSALAASSCTAKPEQPNGTPSLAPTISGRDSAVPTDEMDFSGEEEFDSSLLPEVELPEAFPTNFPIPDGSIITSDVSPPGEDEFHVYVSLTKTLDDTLAYYRTELLANDWTILEKERTDRGTEWTITGEVYSGQLLFVEAEMGVALDVYLYPPEGDDIIPDLPEGLGESGVLGNATGSFPAYFPVPTSYTVLELNEALRAEGYELAFTYVGIAEMGMIDLNIALMAGGWEIGEPILEGMAGMYVLPFTSPDGSFEGFALITTDPGQFGLDTGGAVLIALAPVTL